jgi:hypothetical protein
MSSTGIHIGFNAQATSRKWPSLNTERISASLGARPYPYLVVDRSLDDPAVAKSVTQRHLRDSHRAENCCAPPARSTGSRHSSSGFKQWMLWYSVRGQVCEGLVAKAARKKAKRTAKQGEAAGAESGFAA